MPAGGGDILGKLVGARGTGDDARHSGLAGKPRHGQRQQIEAAAGGERLERLQNIEIGCPEIARAFQPASRWGGFTAAVFAGKQALGKRIVRQDADTVTGTKRYQIIFNIPVEDAPLILGGHEAIQPHLVRRIDGFTHLGGGKI